MSAFTVYVLASMAVAEIVEVDDHDREAWLPPYRLHPETAERLAAMTGEGLAVAR